MRCRADTRSSTIYPVPTARRLMTAVSGALKCCTYEDLPDICVCHTCNARCRQQSGQAGLDPGTRSVQCARRGRLHTVVENAQFDDYLYRRVRAHPLVAQFPKKVFMVMKSTNPGRCYRDCTRLCRSAISGRTARRHLAISRRPTILSKTSIRLRNLPKRNSCFPLSVQ